MSKLATIVALALLLSFTLIYASRPNIGLNDVHKDVVASKASSNVDLGEESCEGGKGEEECLARRTLDAHLDYIYTNLSIPNPDPKH
uniref:Phytosulfokine n=1 Tax=Cicer arietinum TaxID=3827 RepID=A0A1S2Y3X3_CICAR|nr:phytosulfokines-like [Cicer arietinum]